MNTPKKAMVEKGFKSTSWFFRQFSYLFQNPLWHKPLPAGFSVCPYFWMSLFSFFIFRPIIVWPVQYCLRPVMRVVGRPAVRLDDWLHEKLDPPRKFVGSGLLFGLLVVAIVAFTLLVLGIIGMATWQFYLAMVPIIGGLTFFWASMSGLAMILAIGLYELMGNTKCKAHYYIYPWALVFIAAILVLHPVESGQVLAAVGSVFLTLLLEGLGVIWTVIVWCCKYVWIGVSAAATFIWSFLKLSPFAILGFGIPWVFMLLFIGFMGFILDKIVHRQDESMWAPEGPEEIRERNRSNWVETIFKVYNLRPHWKKGEIFIEASGIFCSRLNCGGGFIDALISMRATIIRRAIEIYYEKELDVLQNYPVMFISWKAIAASGGLENRLDELLSQAHKCQKMNLSFSLSYDDVLFLDAMIKACREPDIAKGIKFYADLYEEAERKRRERLERKETSWSRKMCLQITGAIGHVVESSWNGIVKTCKRVGRAIKTFVGNIGVLLAYVWTLIKSKKQGICPYVRFEYVEEKKQETKKSA